VTDGVAVTEFQRKVGFVVVTRLSAGDWFGHELIYVGAIGSVAHACCGEIVNLINNADEIVDPIKINDNTIEVKILFRAGDLLGHSIVFFSTLISETYENEDLGVKNDIMPNLFT